MIYQTLVYLSELYLGELRGWTLEASVVEDLAVGVLVAAEEDMAAREAMMTWGWGCTAMDPLIVTGAGGMVEAVTEEAKLQEIGSETNRSVVKCKTFMLMFNGHLSAEEEDVHADVSRGFKRCQEQEGCG